MRDFFPFFLNFQHRDFVSNRRSCPKNFSKIIPSSSHPEKLFSSDYIILDNISDFKMAANIVPSFFHGRNECGKRFRFWPILLIFFFSASGGSRLEETSPLSSQRQNEMSIRISESVKETKTLEPEMSKEIRPEESSRIVSTEFTKGYFRDAMNGRTIEKPTWAKVEKNHGDGSGKKTKDEKADSYVDSEVISNYYDAIKPTKTGNAMEVKIAQTVAKNYRNSGEAAGVSTNRSRPRKSKWETNYERVKRGFGNSFENDGEEIRGDSFGNVRFDEGKKKFDRERVGKNYNRIAETLEKLARVTVSNDQVKRPNGTVAGPTIFRESREEENRKASPDIQDIITGIVNILNGKATKQADSHGGRPHRPTGTRINNRGPPRISDVPPIDFDGPGPFRPLPPKRIPPPYPFDIPPTLSSIPLPPQPYQPGTSKLPSHPFIDGVPIPELVVPSEPSKKPLPNRPSETAYLEYDTISASEPQNNENAAVVELNKDRDTPEVGQTSIVANATPKNGIKTSSTNNDSRVATDHASATTASIGNGQTDPGKSKPGGQKSPSGINNAGNKRGRPNTGNRPGFEKPPQNKVSAVESPPSKEDRNKTVEESSETKGNDTRKESQKPPGNKEGNDERKSNRTTTETTPLPETTAATEMTQSKVERIDGHSVEPYANRTAEIAGIASATTKVPEVEKNDTEKRIVSGSNETETEIATEPTSLTSVKNETEIVTDTELPVLLEPSLGIGEATPVLESSFPDLSSFPIEQSAVSTTALTSQATGQPVTTTETSNRFKARPGIVLDDPEYKPGIHKRPVITARPIVTAPLNNFYGEIFDVTVHAIQGPKGESSTGKPYIVPVDVDGVQLQNPHVIKGDVSVITKPEEGQKFVSIDGKRTYINLFGEVSPTKINSAATQSTVTGTGHAIPHLENPSISTGSPPRKPYKRPSHPPVRIDTCIVGDDSTCDSAQNERCRTEDGVSSCHCRPGYNRKKHRDACRRVVSMLASIRVDRLYDRRVKWQENLGDPDSEDYQQLSYEAGQAIDSAMSMTPFGDDFISTRINSIYAAKNFENNEPAVYVNVTIQLEENLDTVRPAVKQDIQRHLLRVIQRRNNNVGNSAVWVDAPPGSISALQDVDECSSEELHDCHKHAVCLNTFGSFKCECSNGLRDPWIGNVHREGRFCETCPSDYCNSRGECKFERGQQVCHCSGSFYGTQCEIDGEVLGVAIGASVAAAIIIILTLVCLCMWSRRWSREQKSAVGSGMGSPVFGYMATGPTVKTPSVGAPPYQVSMEDRIRWAQIADVMAKSNHYAQPEPQAKRPGFGGYPTLPSHAMTLSGTLTLPAVAPPVPLPRLTLANKSSMGTYGGHSQMGSIHQSNYGIRSSLETASSSEEEDRADLLGRNFNAPRPKSRTSLANQSGIYYDVDFDRSDAYSKQNTIPMNTYALNSQHQTRSYFR